jgi:hypothetical protein
MSIIMDLMDAQKCFVPHVVCSGKMKGWDSATRLGTQHLGVIMHGVASSIMMFDETLKKDSNLFGTALLKTIVSEFHRRVALRLPWPKRLYLQADNAKDNKNKVIYCLGELLTRLGVYEEVCYSFLPVGHTHEDIDAMFGALSHVLSRKCAFTLQEVRESFHKAWESAKNGDFMFVEVNNIPVCYVLSIFLYSLFLLTSEQARSTRMDTRE